VYYRDEKEHIKISSAFADFSSPDMKQDVVLINPPLICAHLLIQKTVFNIIACCTRLQKKVSP